MKKFAIGIMCGTSLDGVDVSLCEIEGSFINTTIKEIYSNTYKYDSKTLHKIKRILDNDFSLQDICEINVELAQLFSKCVFMLCEESNTNLSDISYIASHGQTIFHVTNEMGTPSSLQLGDGSVLANLTNTTVVSNFRQADIALGGQGAPLVPYVDYVLFQDKKKSRVIQNIGGISNSTYLKRNGTLDDVIAFDNGPGNMMIDYAMNELIGKLYDDSGNTALSGNLIPELFEELMSDSYFKLTPPKSTGRERFGNNKTENILVKYNSHKKEDIITTLTHVTAYGIASSLKAFVIDQIDELYVCGGGAKNKAIMKFLQEYMPTTRVTILEELSISSDYKEALAFAVLGNETMQHQTSNCIKATGAKKETILGQISYVKERSY